MIFQLVVNIYGNFKIESLVLFEGDSYEELIKEQRAYAEAKETMGLKEGENFSFKVYGKDTITNRWCEMFWF